MSARDALYLAALLQELGVFLTRGTPSANGDPHAALAAFLREHAPAKQFLKALQEFPLLSTEPADKTGAEPVLRQLLATARQCATPDGHPAGLEPADAARLRLESPFSRITLQRDERQLHLQARCYLELRPLSVHRESLFPSGTDPLFADNPYPAAVASFLADLERIDDEVGLFALLEKHLHVVPLHAAAPDASLFDAARAAAAVALCLYDEHAFGSWRGARQRIGAGDFEGLPQPCLLVSGGLSGIQDFIFDLPSSRASKSLKGRSYYVQLAAEACVRHLLDTLQLKRASLLYSGGGSFFMLAPAFREAQLSELRRELSAALLDESFSLALGWTPVAVTEFSGSEFAAKWKEAHAQVERRKRRRFQELGVDTVFTPFAQVPRDEEGKDDPFANWTQQVSRNAAFEFKRMRPPAGSAREGGLLERLGLAVSFTDAERDPGATVFNETDFAGRYRDFRFAVKDLPRWDGNLIRRLYPDGVAPRPEIAPETLVDFNHLALLAEQRTGTAKLGVLKMDVDDLGRIFVTGFPEAERTITRMAALSRTLSWFFEGYLNNVLQQGHFEWVDEGPEPQSMVFWQQLYPVFSGGDDFFMVGAWDAVFEFARRVRTDFAAFTGHHPGITLSAALLVVDPKESIARVASRADERLESAKEASAAKDRVSVFDHVLKWAELEEAARLKRRLEVLVKQRGESKQLLQRVQQSATGYERMQDAARRGHFRPEKIWRLAYFLGRNTKKDNRPEIEAIAQQHQDLLLQAFTNSGQASSPALFVVAGRWAELASRDIADAEARRLPLSRT